MKKIAKYKAFVLLLVMSLFSLPTNADVIDMDGVMIEYEKMADGGIKVINARNKLDRRIDLKIDNVTVTLNAHSSHRPNQYARKKVRFDSPGNNGSLLWKYEAPKKEEPTATVTGPEAKAEVAPNKAEVPDKPNRKEKAEISDDRSGNRSANIDKKAEASVRTVSCIDKLNRDPFFGQEAVNEFVEKTNGLCKGISEAESPKQYITDHNVTDFLEESKRDLGMRRAEIPLYAQDLVSGTNVSASAQTSALNLVIKTLNDRIRTREEALNRLEDAVTKAETDSVESKGMAGAIINYCIIGIIVILLGLLIFVVVKRRNRRHLDAPVKKVPEPTPVSQSPDSGDQAIVVRRKTTSILKKQCIDDVRDNPAYMCVGSSEFTPDSAVRNIYIKNTCIKEIYNLYAEDLRNSDNPKEDGCMVLGRWVYEETAQSYDISLEEVVFPGDDAVFKEYELNFGGKIKLRISEKLRKLRRDTNLQYDLVCWVHSHPGLGVFFSNSDDNVQMQLKHAQHPNFLIAFVVDILTSNQEMGIFTFRKDGTMNSKGDITKMYSLEDMYKWALQSERNSFAPENYYNVLGKAKLKMPLCQGVELNNSSIIDLTKIIETGEAGIVGWAIGTSVESNGANEYIVSGIVSDSQRPKAGVTGCVISAAYMSVPTIQRLVAHECRTLSFVMVYSSRKMTLTTIPVINGELLTDEQFYGDVTIDDLKIWTRRRR